VAVGARPVFVDVEADTFGMNPALVEPAITPKTKAILCVHQLGIPCDLAALVGIAKKHGIPLVEDAACALGSEIEWEDCWERIGQPHGVLACFSFHPRKIITTGDGGMITSADGPLAARLRSLRQHAITVSAEARDRDPLVQEAYTEPAYNFRLTDLAAAIGRPQLARLDTFMVERRRLAAAYAVALDDHPVLAAPVERAGTRGNWQSYATRVRPQARMSQEDVLRFFLERGVACRRGLTNAHEEPAYAGRDHWRAGSPLTMSEQLRRTTVMLPLFHGMTKAEERTVAKAIAELRGRAVREP
jgi:dTDP-4-amino-4,6-dideoxygalactose transaminase